MKKYINIVLLIIWMIFIFMMSSYDAVESSSQSGYFVNLISDFFSNIDTDILSFIIRKIGHFIEYFILGILSYNVIKSYNKNIVYAIIICILYAISDEIHQIFIVGRTFRVFDIFIDSSGSFLAVYLVNYIYRNKYDN